MNVKMAIDVYRRLVKARRVVLLSDFDGTLANIIEDPEAVAMIPDAREAVYALAARGATDVGIISGRSLDDVIARVGLANVSYAGCSGLELEIGTTRIEPPNAEALKRLIADASGVLTGSLNRSGVRIEDKGYSIAVHWREHPDAEPVARRAVDAVVRAGAGQLEVTEGKMVLELAPAGVGGKAFAVRMLLDAFERNADERIVVYLGDDVVDEEAFEVVRGMGGVTIRVGPRGRDTHAEHRVSDPDSMARFLQALAEIRAPYPEGG